MATYQLRIYTINRGMMDSWIALFNEHIRPLHDRLGIPVVSSYVNADRTEFIWVRRFDTADLIPEKEAAYFASPERTALGHLPTSHIAKMEVKVMDSVVAAPAAPNRAYAAMGDAPDGVPDIERCPMHPERYLLHETTAPSFVRHQELTGDQVYMCKGDGATCSWRYSVQVGLYSEPGMAHIDLNEDFRLYQQARKNRGLPIGSRGSG